MTWFPKLTEAPLKKVGTILKQDATKSNAERDIENDEQEASNNETANSTDKKKKDGLLDIYV
ncbi:hypothetical protein [Enterovibrio norvegicus]|uniref:Uncharacterized protein n=2 Tax=Enterovibrio norvegicus TaxID=188144 RepID=A0A2N7L564_9GAMM|nr:hypothetical protein [Enterovibrio norvegicus]MCC4798017.1 hypothetical protein [Enterovibrio norvegicus]OEE51594.1 hypothetical protein A1OS_05950 [Enterovibrio norvegicus]OEF51438.1 hypothetical protein A1OW_09530 [Enterovibrio norvegicus]OEF58661.1 hypothetical protein A1OU_10920 [Enterovibrio norvegicus]PMH72624.1 hypothetical protein BCU62_03110 [Enterovibrio norvegicus]